MKQYELSGHFGKEVLFSGDKKGTLKGISLHPVNHKIRAVVIDSEGVEHHLDLEEVKIPK